MCEAAQKPGSRRLASGRQNWEFNKVVGLDHLTYAFVNLNETTTDIDFLNILCWGTSRQQLPEALDKTALGTRKRVMIHWVAPFGLPELFVCDQGTEFTGEEFSQFFMHNSVLVHFTDARSPWQNGPTERAGGIIKDMFTIVIKDMSIQDVEEFKEFVPLIVAQRNARANKSGFSPDQRSFGRNLRLPGHMLTEDDPVDPDLAGSHPSDAVRRIWDVQDASARAAVTRRSREQCNAALKHTKRRMTHETKLNEGSWVMVWRK